MNWRHVHLIFMREMRDQVRDRRTLFTITILPLLLYPLLGMLMMQVAQFKRDQTVRVRIVGLEHWPDDARLVRKAADPNEHAALIAGEESRKDASLIEVDVRPWPGDVETAGVLSAARQSLDDGAFDAVLVIEPEFKQLLSQRGAAREDGSAAHEGKPAAATTEHADAAAGQLSPGLQLVANMARDRSQLAVRRLQNVLREWQRTWVSQQLADAGMNPVLVEPLPLKQNDTSERSVRRAMLWSKILPFIMLVWALTGAFYPAIDLCAGEKERGTLETLLSSPARRKEIVWGKLFTIATFSMLSALLNLLSMHLTAGFIVEQFATQGAPQLAEAFGRLPIHAFGWLVLLLLPMSAFFSALALAVAALARSTKEGQYYLMPLLLFTLPLVCLPMIPSMELNLATSMVPVSGAILLVRALIEGRFAEAFIHLPVVIAVTATCCLLAIRWAVRQFESEAVMFSESERWSFQSWIRQVWRDRGIVASPSEALLCGLIILVAMFFSQFIAGPSDLTWQTLAERAVVTQIGLILTPCLLMAIFLTRSLRQALRLHRVPLDHLAAAVILGLALHPSYVLLGQAISNTLQIGAETQQVLNAVGRLINAQPLWSVLLVLAVLPACCEELTFRGFIFGGLLRNNGVMRAIILSALFFGLAHSFLQQSIAAGIMGLLLGMIAWRTGSVVCTMLIHVVNNSLSISLGWMSDRELALPGSFDWMVRIDNGQWHYQPAWITLSLVVALAMLVVLWRRSPTVERLAQAELV
ncbi:MAG: ABC transporter permease subunit/CPBP intramembrane protease [Aureliella sp.]